MIVSLRIQNFAIIEDLEVEFNHGLNIITGETGAGKSIIIDALSLLLGERSSFSQIRNGATKAFIEGTFYIEKQALVDEIHQIIDGLIEEDRLLIVSRTLDTSGRTIIRLNQKTANQSMTKAIMSRLFDIHSQHENLELLNENHHLTFLDTFNDEKKALADYQEVFRTYLEEKRKLHDLQTLHLSEEEAEFLRFQVTEIEKANIIIGELDDLERKKTMLLNIEKYVQIKQNLHELLDGDTGAITRLYLARRELEHARLSNLDEFGEKLDALYYELRDTGDDIIKVLTDMTKSELSLEQISDRLYIIKKIAKKYGPSEEEIILSLEEMKQKLLTFEKHAYLVEEQTHIVEAKKEAALRAASILYDVRKDAAGKLAKTIDIELDALALKNAHFKIAFSDKELSDDGNQNIAFTLSANLGSPYLPLKNAISGGEASRLMLGLKVVLHRLGLVETIIFDEVDTGVSGRIAKIVGQKIKNLSTESQIIAITHLPQVAAYGDYHYRVHKYVDQGSTKATIALLDEKEHIQEIASMIAGDSVNEASLEAAKALIAESH